jgi:membrane-associated protease RseP (regulator of RpoE activity)
MIGGVGSGDRWDAMLDAAIEGSDVKVRRSSSGYGASDHSSFYGAKIPVLFFNTGLHPELHTPRDTLALINFEGAVKSVNLADGILRQLLGEEQRMAYVAPKPGQNPIADMMRRGAYLGFSPGEAPGELKGVAIDTLSDDGPAAKAGLKVGDVIEKIGDTPITSQADLRTLLMKYQGGEKVKIAARRGEEAIEVEATLGKR